MSPRLFSRPWVRVACAVLATAVLAVVVWAAGAQAVLQRLGSSAHALPALAVLEAVMVACSTLALRALYGPVAGRVSARQWLRVGAAGGPQENPIQRPPHATPNHRTSEVSAVRRPSCGRAVVRSIWVTRRRMVNVKRSTRASEAIFTQNGKL